MTNNPWIETVRDDADREVVTRRDDRSWLAREALRGARLTEPQVEAVARAIELICWGELGR